MTNRRWLLNSVAVNVSMKEISRILTNYVSENAGSCCCYFDCAPKRAIALEARHAQRHRKQRVNNPARIVIPFIVHLRELGTSCAVT